MGTDRRSTLAAYFLFLFLHGLTFDAECGHWAGFQSRIRDFFFTAFADAIDLLVHPLERLIDFLQELLLALPDTHREILIHLGGGLITYVGKCLLPISLRNAFPGFIKNGLALTLKITPDGTVFISS